MENTKGYFSVKGKIWSLSNKEAKDFGLTKNLSFGIQTSKDNSLFIQVGEWKNTKLNVKIKSEGMEKTEEINEQDAIDKIKEEFKDGDSVFINVRTEVDTYNKNMRFLVNQMYIEKEPLDFDSPDFVEVNELNQTIIIIDKPEKRAVKAGLTTYKGEMIEQELKLSDDDINDYFMENVKVGDVMKVAISVNRKPNYIDGETQSERKTLKGKTVKSGRRTIDKTNPYTESLEVTDVDLEKVEKQKYTREEIRIALDLVNNKVTTKKEDSNSKIEDDDLPF